MEIEMPEGSALNVALQHIAELRGIIRQQRARMASMQSEIDDLRRARSAARARIADLENTPSTEYALPRAFPDNVLSDGRVPPRGTTDK